MLVHNTGPTSNNEQYLVLTQDEGEEGDEGVISYIRVGTFERWRMVR